MKALAILGAVLAMASAAFGQEAATPAKPTEPPATTEKIVYVQMKTSMGDISLELNQEKAPITVKNFLAYTDKKFYDGTIFHRVISNFMIQGGGFTADMKEKQSGEGIKNEWQNGLKNSRGSIAMARVGYQPDSAKAQFFINVADNAGLDQPRDGAGYAVFGKVVKGMETVDKIKAVDVGTRNGHGDVPVKAITIESVRRMTEAEVAALKAEKK
ncbi:MAG: peptidylprolyl isomerase [Phycisphaerales bacterium]